MLFTNVENDLRSWPAKLENLRQNLTATNSSITLREDPKITLIPKINLSITRQQIISNESFLRSVGDIQIEDNGQVGIHEGQKRSDAFLCGKNEYSIGKHKIRFDN